MIKTLRPRDYNEALHVGHFFRNKRVPVVMDLTGLSDDVARQFVDFAAGLVFGRGGDMERLSSKVFLLVPGGIKRPAVIPPPSPGPEPVQQSDLESVPPSEPQSMPPSGTTEPLV